MAENSTHRTIMISSGLMGAQQVVRLAVGVVQSKIVAVLLGTAGTGAFGAYASLMGLWQGLFGLGIRGSGVRQIAKMRGTDPACIPHQQIHLQIHLVAFMGFLATFTMFIFRGPLSRVTFGTSAYASGIGFLAVATGISLVSESLLTTLKGLRRIRDLTYANMLGAVFSAVWAVGIIFIYRDDGIAPAFLAASCCAWLAAWLLFRRIGVQKPGSLSFQETRKRVIGLVQLGGGFMSVSLFITLTAYAIRAILNHYEGLESAGLYQSAWMLSTFYCSMVLQAMGTDFLPRISAVCADTPVFVRQINEQTEVVVSILVPGILVCMVLAAPVLRFLYTAEFLPAVDVARWMLMGMLIRAAGWPLAYIPLALNRPLLTFVSEGLVALTLIGLSLFLIPHAGVVGAGVAFFIVSIVYNVILLMIAHRLCRFRWSRRCVFAISSAYGAGALVFGSLLVGTVIAYGVACVTVVVVCLASACYILKHLFNWKGKRHA